MPAIGSRLRPCVAILLLAGCSSPGVFVTRAGDGNPAKLGTAPVDGTYGLFVAGEGRPDFFVVLKAGDPLGFETSDLYSPYDVKVALLYGVAGKDKLRLRIDRTYEWRRLSEVTAARAGPKSDAN